MVRKLCSFMNSCSCTLPLLLVSYSLRATTSCMCHETGPIFVFLTNIQNERVIWTTTSLSIGPLDFMVPVTSRESEQSYQNQRRVLAGRAGERGGAGNLMRCATSCSEKCRLPSARARCSSQTSSRPLLSRSIAVNHCEHNGRRCQTWAAHDGHI